MIKKDNGWLEVNDPDLDEKLKKVEENKVLKPEIRGLAHVIRLYGQGLKRNQRK